MRSFYSVAGVLAAVGPAAAVPQSYSGYYPMPNGTHSTGPIGTGTGVGIHHSSTVSVSPVWHRPTTATSTDTSTRTNTHYVTAGAPSGSGHPGTACGGASQTVTVTEKVRETVTITRGVFPQADVTSPGPLHSTTHTRVPHGHSYFHSHHSHATHKPSLPGTSPITQPYTLNNATSTRPIGTGTGSHPSSTWSPTWTPPTTHSPSPISTNTPYNSTVPTSSPTTSPIFSSTVSPVSTTTTPTPITASSTSSTPRPTPTYTPSTGKRGVSYNNAELVKPFEQYNQITWAYNWGQTSNGCPLSIEYVPMLWGNSAGDTSTWSDNVAAAIKAGSTDVLAFNEPDMSTQANMDPTTAVQAFKQYMSPLAGQVRIGSPSVTNGAAPMGLSWLQSFMSQCTNCPIDFVTVHWYNSASSTQDFKDHVTQAHQMTGKPVWVTEFGATGSNEEISTFLADVMGWMDQQDFVERYAYFMASDGLLLSSSSTLSSYGRTYASSA